ncbi:uncharacterized protein LOC107418457 [Ziziphus jujuba]|uniref:Uncharacterized protein LOC107418457 n=2 Tax=Ziziphus jujuba TaxID=326968 RepID=A0A6P4A3J8_ZIZJJ|nr:uncharacterized protein LOC107418457 [Ziziphus jujuba]KAH7532993.1 hypothetical protein FEM48_Zijuj04G0082500 [Ziziphus jujuba var. spinosa]
MKFLKKLGSCCSCTSAMTKSPEKTIPEGSSTTSTGDASSSTTTSVSKRKTSMVRCKSAMHWQPGLSSISEDGLVPIVEEGSRCTDHVIVSQKKSLPSSSSTKAKSEAMARSFIYGDYDYEEEYKRRKRRLFRIPAFSQLSASPYILF